MESFIFQSLVIGASIAIIWVLSKIDTNGDSIEKRVHNHQNATYLNTALLLVIPALVMILFTLKYKWTIVDYWPTALYSVIVSVLGILHAERKLFPNRYYYPQKQGMSEQRLNQINNELSEAFGKIDDEVLTDLAIIKAKEDDQFKNFLANEADALQRKKINEREEAESRRAALKENSVMRSELLEFINDPAKLEAFYLFLNRNFQLWSRHIGENGLLSLRFLAGVKSYSRTEDIISVTVEIMTGVELQFKLFQPDMLVRINAELLFEWRYTDDLVEQPHARYETAASNDSTFYECSKGVKLLDDLCLYLISLVTTEAEDLDSIGHSFYAFGITADEIRPFLRSLDYDVNFVFDEYSGVVERITLNYYRNQDHGFNLEQAAYDQYDYNVFRFSELTDYIAPAAYLLIRLRAIRSGVLYKRSAADSSYIIDPYFDVTTTSTLFKADNCLEWIRT